MFKTVRLAAASFILGLSVSVSAQAAVTDFTDYGDYLHDHTTGLDWLDVTASVNRSFNDVSAHFGTGGDFEGWRYANVDEVYTLVEGWTGLELVQMDQFSMFHQDEIDGLVSWMGSTLDSSYISQYGMTWDEMYGYEEGEGMDLTRGLASMADGSIANLSIWDDDASGFDYLEYYGTTGDVVNDMTGSFLVRQGVSPVSEPATYALLLGGLGFVGFIANRRKKACIA